MIGGQWVKNAEGREVYEGGKWVEVIYSRPMLRQRVNIFGTGADYGKTVNAGAPVWRVGANQTTVFKTEVPLMFGSARVPAGEYSMFVELKGPTEWTLILSTWPRQKTFNAEDKTALYGSAGYTPDKDVLRVKMMVESEPVIIDQLSIFFCDVTKDAATLAIVWESTVATVPFTVGR